MPLSGRIHSRPDSPCRRSLLIALLATSIFALAPAALGQDTYTLTDEDQWKATQTAQTGTPAGQLAAARKALAAGELLRATNLTTRWIETFPYDPLIPEAYMIRGDTLVAQHSYYEALYDYEFVARSHPSSAAFVQAVTREYEIAKLFANGVRRKFLGLRIMLAYDEAQEIFIRVQERLPGSQIAEQAGLALGDFYYRRREMQLAADTYAVFIENYPHSDNIPLARRRLIFANIASYKGPEFDAVGILEARAQLEQLDVVSPAQAQRIGSEALVLRINESEAEKMLTTAEWYLAVGDPISAEYTIRLMIFEHPNTVAAARALRLIPSIVPNLPASVISQMPDYSIYQEALLDNPGQDQMLAEETVTDETEAANMEDLDAVHQKQSDMAEKAIKEKQAEDDSINKAFEDAENKKNQEDESPPATPADSPTNSEPTP